MINKSLIAFCFLLLAFVATGQDKYYTKSAIIGFYSDAPLEDIEAKNKSAVVVFDKQTASLQFSVLIKGFEFENEEMQQHFNDDYMESSKFPKAEFKGQINNMSSVNYSKNGNYPVLVKGQLTIHGVTKEVETSGNISIIGNELKAHSTFSIQVADYYIIIPRLVRDKIAKTVKIFVSASLQPLKS